MSNQPDIGKNVRYQARLTGQIIISPEESGSVMVYIPYALVNTDFSYSGIHSVCIVQKDGTPSSSAVENLAKIFKLHDVDEFMALQDIEPNTTGTPDFELADWYEDTYKDVTSVKPRWINSLGGGFRKNPLDAKGQKQLVAKFGSKFKAILVQVDHSGTAEPEGEDKPAEEKQEELPARGKGPPPMKKGSGKPARKSDQDTVWNAYEGAHPVPKGKKPAQHVEELGETFWKEVTRIVGSEDPDAYTAEDWGKVADEMGY
jgi:hypothetical protein